MKKINFTEQLLPHLVAVAFFLLVTVIFFNPIFFENKTLNQHDITQYAGAAKAIKDFREQTGEVALWSPSMYGGMPAYLISVNWNYEPMGYLKTCITLFLPHPVRNIYLAFLCYYIMLLVFNVRPYLAIGGAIAFGLSSYMIIGLGAGHNARIGAIAYMPLVMAGIHLAFSNRKVLGFAVTATALALHIMDNHLQMTYYLIMIVSVYGLVQLVYFINNKKTVEFAKALGVLIVAAGLALATMVGPLWSLSEYTTYSTRGKSQLASASAVQGRSGVSKEYAFQYSDGILEPMTLMIPNFYGGSSFTNMFDDANSASRRALQQQGVQYDSKQMKLPAYWGDQPFTAPYYCGATLVFLFALGVAFVDRKILWWLLPISILSIVMSWGSNFESFNYFLFDYLPGYNRFRTVTFALVIIFFAIPLLGMLGLEKVFEKGIDKVALKKVIVVLAATGGLCLILLIFAGLFRFTNENEANLPPWLLKAVIEDRKGFFRHDALRSLTLIVITFSVIYFVGRNKISANAFYAFLTLMITFDLVIVDRRYLSNESYQRNHIAAGFTPTMADLEILKDTSYYRVYSLAEVGSARPSYFHSSLSGYHGAPLRRYQDLNDSCLSKQTNQLIQGLQARQTDFSKLGVINMLNTKYIVFGPDRSNFIPNDHAYGNAWFVRELIRVKSANDELKMVGDINTREVAVVDESNFQVSDFRFDSASVIVLTDHNPNYLKYESQSTQNGFVVFSEIYYPEGWTAWIDGRKTEIFCANYALRALQVPAGKHSIEFKFEPMSYVIGNKITMASSWVMIVVLLGSLGWSSIRMFRGDVP